MREHIADESVDLVYLDPPFNSNRSYNVLFKDESGHEAESQIEAFDDTWHWNAKTEAVYDELVTVTAGEVGSLVAALRQAIGANQMMAYLVMMAARLVQLHRVLKPTGSLYLHCDPTASHYLKVLLDSIFGAEHFRTEITWKRSSAHSDTKQGRRGYGNISDRILYYTKSDTYTFNTQYSNYDDQYLAETYNNVDPDGRRWKSSDLTGPGGAAKGNPLYEFLGVQRYWRFSKENMAKLLAEGRIYQSKPGAVPRMKHYLDEMKGIALQDIWDDIPPIAAQAAERLGYPTQKPLALLDRIIQVSCPDAGIVLDPFCGCGTTIAAAETQNRRWIGIDITHLAISLQKYRMADMFPNANFNVIGEPEDIQDARQLAQDNRYQFQWWALSLINARPLGGQGGKAGKKGSDKGIDGVLTFIEDTNGKPAQILVQVKSGHVRSGDIRDLIGTLDREKAAMGLFITLEPPTRDMDTEAATAGIYHSTHWGDFPRFQIRTIEDILHGKEFKTPPPFGTFKGAAKVDTDPKANQSEWKMDA
jgi:site-specific DNA-methyltransferase (adenine-specific)